MHWNIDTAHSTVGFAVKHMAISTVRGAFRDFTATAQTDDAGTLLSLSADIRAGSIDTGVAPRDAHLRSADFFWADEHPEITFRSTRVTRMGRDEYEVVGDLSMRGVTRPATLTVVIGDSVRDGDGNARMAAEATGRINRRDWGLNWNQALELGGVLVSEEVKFTIDVQAVAAAPAEVPVPA